jgi:MFS family permease
MAEKGIFRWFSTSRSVLGSVIPAPLSGHAMLARASIVYAPIGFLTIFVVVCLFVVALVVTASMVDAIGREQKPDVRKALAELAPRQWRILLFSLKFLVVFGVATAVVTALSYCLFYAIHRPDHLTSAMLLPVLVLVGVGCAVWLVTPAAIRLLRAYTTGQVLAEARNRGTIIAVLASEAGLALGMIAQRLETPIALNSRWELSAVLGLNSIVANAPDVLVFIALALLAAEYSPESENNKGSKTDELLQRLMPLHFD